MAGCCPQRAVVNTSKADSIRVVKDVVYVERLRDTTIYVQLPQEERESVRPDSSCLQTSLAVSNAWITQDGLLYHDLKNKPGRVAVDASVKETETVTVEKEIIKSIEIKEVPVKLPLTGIEKFLIVMGVACLIYLLGRGLFVLYKLLR